MVAWWLRGSRPTKPRFGLELNVVFDDVIVDDLVVVDGLVVVAFLLDVSGEPVLEVLALMESGFELIETAIGLVVHLLVYLVFGHGFAVDEGEAE